MKFLQNRILSTFIIPLACTLGLIGCKGENPIIPDATQVLDCDFFAQEGTITLTDNEELAVDYIIDCKVATSADLVIEPGVVIEFTSGSGIEILDEGSFVAEGTQALPIILTGEDKIAGSWLGVLNNSNNVNNSMRYVTISYGGGGAFNSNDDIGNFIMWAQARMSIENCTFSDGAGYGVNFSYSEITVPSFSQNTLVNNNVPVFVIGTYLHLMDASNDFSGNTNDYIETNATSPLDGDYTWQNCNVPYRVNPSGFGIFRVIEIPSESNITVEPGTVMEFTSDTGIEIEEGSFKAEGTATAPITFTGVDGAAGAWKGIEYRFSQSINNSLDYVIIEYAGSGDNESGIYMWADPVLSVTNSTFRDIAGCGVRDFNSTFSNPNFSGSGNTFENVSGGDFCGD